MSEFGGVVQPEEWHDGGPIPARVRPPRPPAPRSFALPTIDPVTALDQIADLIRGGQTDMLAEIEKVVIAAGRLGPVDSLTGVPGPAIDDVDGATELDVTPEDPTP